MKCYNCNLELPPTGGRCPNCGQVIYTTMGSPNAAMGRRIDGCLPPTESLKDFKAVPNLQGLPRRVDLRPECTPVEDQGQVGSCTANAAVGALEYQRRRDGKPNLDLSRLFVYYNSRKMTGRESEDCGATIAQCMAALLAFGAPAEASWPYDPTTVKTPPAGATFDEALKNTPREYAKVEGLEHVKGALARHYPVVFGITLPDRCFEEAGRTGVMPTPTRAELDAVATQGGHAMLLVGYDADQQSLLVRNSWGAQWGTHGYCTMSFETFESTRAAATSWILGNLEASGAFTVRRPAITITPVQGSVKDLASKMRDDLRGSLTKDLAEAMRDVKNRVPRG